MKVTKIKIASGGISKLACIFTVVFVSTALSAQPTEVKIIDNNGSSIGIAKFTPAKSGVRIQVQASGLSPGRHGLHIHSAGICEPPAFKSAGPHYSPENRKHGFLHKNGPHAGDLPMLDVNSDGKVSNYDVTTARLSLTPDSLLNLKGTSLIIHAEPDDYLTDTGGNTGDRIACGVISAGGQAEDD